MDSETNERCDRYKTVAVMNLSFSWIPVTDGLHSGFGSVSRRKHTPEVQVVDKLYARCGVQSRTGFSRGEIPVLCRHFILPLYSYDESRG